MAETALKVLGDELVRDVVRAEWIDINQHMNVAYYVLAFDLAIDALWERFGLGGEYFETRHGSTFAVESHIEYKRELLKGDPYIVTTQILAFDEKRIHQFMRMYHAEQGYLAATSEWMNLHVNIRERKVTPWPESILGRISEFVAGQDQRIYSEDAGKTMHIKKPLYRADANREST